mgnify:CR=1 FL=1
MTPPKLTPAQQERADMRDDWYELDKRMALMAAELAGVKNAMTAQVAGVLAAVDDLKKSIAGLKTQWWHQLPIVVILLTLGGVYVAFDDRIKVLENTDRTVMSERAHLRSDIDELKREISK